MQKPNDDYTKRIPEEIQDNVVLITGGTGSFGHQMARRILTFQPKRVVVFSRDEKKQTDMAYEFNGTQVSYVVGDVRDAGRLNEAMKDVNIVYHAAALKQVPSCESHPLEAIKTNVLGAENVRTAAIRNGVKVVVGISTDKAVKPVNVMGMTKALQERILLSASAQTPTRFNVVRYGNVLGSRGSVIPLFMKSIRLSQPLPITHPAMTRYLLTLDEAVDLVFRATASEEGGRVFVRKSPAAKVVDLARAIGKLVAGDDGYPTTLVGIRPGEKIHETLVSEDEMRRSIEEESYFIIRQYDSEKFSLINHPVEYTSATTKQLGLDEICKLLSSSAVLQNHGPLEGELRSASVS